MATFGEHISQAKGNLSFLVEVNQHFKGNWDWQVTISYYSAVHLMNAHIAKIADLHYRTHEDLKNAINPFNAMSLCQVPESIYLAYTKLEGLSRRSRYLCHEDPQRLEKGLHITYDKHFAKAIKQLDQILIYFQEVYGINFENLIISCQDLNHKSPINIFTIKTV